MKFKSAIITALASCALVLISSVPAQAAETTGYPANCKGMVKTSGGSGCFVAKGDYFWSHDTAVDGRGVYLFYETSYGRKGSCAHVYGGHSYYKCNRNLAEKTQVKFHIEVHRADWDGVISISKDSPWVWT